MRKMKKIVIIGANDFQKPLILKAKEMGYETHVFAWREGATGAEDADYFYEISIVEKDEILKICQKIQPDAVATIGSDLANITVQYLVESGTRSEPIQSPPIREPISMIWISSPSMRSSLCPAPYLTSRASSARNTTSWTFRVIASDNGAGWRCPVSI